MIGDETDLPPKITTEQMKQGEETIKTRTKLLEEANRKLDTIIDRLDLICKGTGLSGLVAGGYCLHGEPLSYTAGSFALSFAALFIAWVIKKLKDKLGVDLSKVVRKDGLRKTLTNVIER